MGCKKEFTLQRYPGIAMATVLSRAVGCLK
jgi:hypothetical protein